MKTEPLHYNTPILFLHGFKVEDMHLFHLGASSGSEYDPEYGRLVTHYCPEINEVLLKLKKGEVTIPCHIRDNRDYWDRFKNRDTRSWKNNSEDFEEMLGHTIRCFGIRAQGSPYGAETYRRPPDSWAAKWKNHVSESHYLDIGHPKQIEVVK